MITSTQPHEGFQPPGPGGWIGLGDHFPGALTPEYQLLYAETCPPGMADSMARYGVLANGVDVAFVHGHVYIAPVPLVGPREVEHMPPHAVLWLASRCHPAFRRRTRAARTALAQRPWRDAATAWFSHERSTWVARNRAVEQLDIASLGATALAVHLGDCSRLARDGYRRHFELHGDDLIPVGLLIARAAELGLDDRCVTSLLRGAPHRDREPIEAAWQLISGYDLDGLARCEFQRQPPPSCATRAGFDVGTPEPYDGEHRDELFQLAEDARVASALRDDNGEITGAWPLGLLRRAMLEAGRRLALSDPALAVEATVAELVAALNGDEHLADEELRDRFDDRRRRSALPAPPRLGGDLPIPPLDALPRPLALLNAAQLAAADHMTGSRPIGIGTTPYTGRALVVDDPGHALDLIEPGDIIVTRFTCPSWNSALALAGGLVTSTGGMLSHAAVLARELGLPAVIGLPSALHRIESGAIVTLDPARATVVR